MLEPVWKDALAAAGLTPAADDPLRFAAADAEARAAATGTVFAPLAHLAPIAVAGADRVSFLQGQTSNDVRLVDAARAQLTSVNTPKGRVFALGTLQADGERLLLWTEAALADALRKRLQMYVLRANAALSDARAERLTIGISGPQTEAVLAAVGLKLPREIWSASTSLWERPLAANAVRLPGNTERALIVCEAIHVSEALRTLALHATPAGTDAWRLTDVHAGLPTVLPATQDFWVAQMLDLDRLGGVHFDKGCYTGQEIVARMHYLGRLKQRLYRATSPAAVAPGTAVRGDASGGQAVGEVVMSALDAGERHALLAVLRHEAAGGPLCAGDARLEDVAPAHPGT